MKARVNRVRMTSAKRREIISIQRFVVMWISAVLIGIVAINTMYFSTDLFVTVDVDTAVKSWATVNGRSITNTVVSWEHYVEVASTPSGWSSTAVDPGQTGTIPAQYNVTDAEIQADIAAGLYTAEDYAYLVALGGESNTYEGFYAVACSIRNRVEDPRFPNSYKEVASASGQYSGYNPSEIANPRNSDIRDAAVAVLRGGPSTVGSCTFFFGRINGNDMWASGSIAEFYNVGGNIFYNTWGEMHNVGDCPAGGIQIYNHNTGEWIYPSGSKYP